jgi:hypothetical protein
VAVVGAEIEGRIDQAGGPRHGQHEHAAAIGVGAVAGQAPGLGADHGVEDHGRRQQLPPIVAAAGVADQAELPRHQLAAQVADATDADDVDRDPLVVDGDHPADGTPGHDPIASAAIDAGGDLGARRQRYRQRVDIGEATEARRHRRSMARDRVAPPGWRPPPRREPASARSARG